MEKEKLEINKDFSFPAKGEWEKAAEKLLKGKPFEETLYSQTDEGLTIKPIYNSSGGPGLYLGNQGDQRKWSIAQSLFSANDTFNEVAQTALSKGQTALNIDLDLVSQFGNNALHFPEFMGYVHVTEYEAFNSLFNGIDLNKVPLLFDALNSGAKIFEWLKKYINEYGFTKNKITGGIGIDPISAALKYGGFITSYDDLIKKSAPVFKQKVDLPNVDIFTIQSNLIHNSGGHKVQELSYFLSVVAEYISCLSELGIQPEQVLSKIRVKISVGNDQFLEITKIRAIRLLWQNLCDAYKVDANTSLKIDVETSLRFMSVLDHSMNMLRATGAAFSAIIGGCDSLDVLPFDLTLGKPDEFSMRQARNIQIILAEESNLNKVIDPALGSGYLDQITNDLAEKSWQTFQKIEEKGGILKQIRNGKFQQEIENNASKQSGKFENGDSKAIGTNIYPNPDEKSQKKTERKISFESFTGEIAEKIKPLVQKRVLEKIEDSL